MTIPVHLESVSVELGANQVLDEISLDVDAGELVTLLGPSGSGKTTTLNVIAGFVRQRSGHVRFGAELVDRLPVHKREIGIVFQDYALFPHLTVSENVAYALRNRGVRRAERARRAEEMLDLVHLPGLAHRRVHSLSGGQRQRVAVARALIFEPRVLLLDEPMAALDRRLREAMQIELKRIQREIGVTTIGVTHDQVEAMTMSDRIAIMNDGRIEQVGTPEQLYRFPASLFVARFLGETNLLPVDPGGMLAGLGLELRDARSGTGAIRPEDIDVCPPGDESCLATGHIEDSSYQGTRYRLVVRLPGGETVVVSAKTKAAPVVGNEVGLTYHVDAVHVIDERSSAVNGMGHAGSAPETTRGATSSIAASNRST